MLYNITLIASTENIAMRAHSILKSLGLPIELTVHTCFGDDVTAAAQDAYYNGADVIVTRGINCSIAQNAVDIPVVEIPISSQDIICALQDAKRHAILERPRIGFFPFSPLKYHMEMFSDLLNIDLHVHHVRDDLKTVCTKLVSMKENGISIVVAGMITEKIAREQGFTTLTIDSKENALRSAFYEAYKVASSRRLESTYKHRIQSIANISSKGILIVDTHGYIQAINREAQSLLQLPTSCEGHNASAVLPDALLAWCRQKETATCERVNLHGNELFFDTKHTNGADFSRDTIFTLYAVQTTQPLKSKNVKALPRQKYACKYSFNDILGDSEEICKTIHMARFFGGTDNPILLFGETGTGKELFAQSIHMASPHAQGPFVVVNCAGLTSSLLESELFGYEDGAFTGARQKGRAGLFEIAHNGTIFLDEISEMDHHGQTRLLRVLQENTITRVGGHSSIPINARIIAASNKNLAELVQKKQFRQDLYYRLHVLPLTIPPLRERKGDITCLAKKFVEENNAHYKANFTLSPQIIATLESHTWPGNVRELIATIKRLILLSKVQAISPELVQSILSVDFPQKIELPQADIQHSHSPERFKIVEALQMYNGNVNAAASHLNMHRTTLQRKIRSFSIQFKKTAQ